MWTIPLFFVSFLISVSSNEDVTTTSPTITSSSSCPVAKDNSDCLVYLPEAKSVLVREAMGRLGNQMFTYKMLLAMRLKFGYRSFLSRKSLEILGPVFDQLDMGVAEDELCDFERIATKYRVSIKEQRMNNILKIIQNHFGSDYVPEKDSEGKWSIPRDLYENSGFPFDQVVHTNSFNHLSGLDIEESCYPWEAYSNRSLLELAWPELQTGKALILYPEGYGSYSNESDFINDAPNLIPTLEKSFTPRPHFVEAAKITFAKIVAKHESKLSDKKGKKKLPKSWTFVGIHSRRTDHLSYEVEKGNIALKPSYFLQAMDLYREAFKNVIFIYISDDIEWGRKHLGTRNKMGDLYFAGDGIPNEASSIGHDLALMTMCNHTIISYGTFSFWVSFLAGGATISPFHFPEYRLPTTNLSVFGRNPIKFPLPRLHPHF